MAATAIMPVVIEHYARQKGAQPFALPGEKGQLNRVLRDLLARTGTSFPIELQVKDARIHITFWGNRSLTE